jgi:acyl-CoA synthetase (AMP-forming)/AMP-acid ligase II
LAEAEIAITRVHDVLAKRVSAAANAKAVMEGECQLSNHELHERVDAVSRYLLSAGVRPGDRVATLAPPGIDFWVTFLAATSVGAIWLGMNPAYRRQEYEYILQDAGPRVIFASEAFDGRNYFAELRDIAPIDIVLTALVESPMPASDERLAAGRPIGKDQLAVAREAVASEDPAVIVYTSGTTGRPKGAVLSHRAIVQTALSNLAWMPAAGLVSAVCVAPINHVGGLNNICFTVFASGGRIIFHPRVDLVRLAEINQRERPTYLVGSPTAWAMMIAAGVDFGAVDFYKLIVFGGAASTVAQLQEVRKTGAQMSSVYGQTETTGMITFNRADDTLEVMSETIGQPIRGNAIRIADPDGRPLPLGETGEIQVRGVSVMSFYWNKPQATEEAFTHDGWLKTGDLGIQRPDGNIVFAGRLKEMFKSGGYNVYPVEVELAICEHAAVAQAVVVAVEHPTFQEVGHAFLLPKPGRSIDPAELREFLRERIASYKIPKSWEVLDALPFLPNGKVDRRALATRTKA